MSQTIQTNFVPEIWSARFTSRLDDALVWGARANANYEGDISGAGDTVHIPTPTTTVTVKDYTIDTDIGAAELAGGSDQELDIDQQKYFHFYVDDIDAAQSRPSIMDDAMGRAARAMAIEVDTFLQGKFSTDGYNASRREGAGGANHAANSTVYGKAVIGAFINQKLRMTQADIPAEGRWAVVPPEMIAGLERYFLIEQDSGAQYIPATEEQALRSGFAGNLLGFSLFTTRRVVAGANEGGKATKRCVLGQGNEAVTLARQITQNEAYRPERRFGDAVKGLMVYGGKNVLPDRLFYIDVQTAT